MGRPRRSAFNLHSPLEAPDKRISIGGDIIDVSEALIFDSRPHPSISSRGRAFRSSRHIVPETLDRTLFRTHGGGSDCVIIYHRGRKLWVAI